MRRAAHATTPLLALAALASCGGRVAPASGESPVAAGKPGPEIPEPTSEPVPKPVPKAVPTISLPLNKPVVLGDEGQTMAQLRDYTIEEIAAAPGDAEAYPAGSGVTMTIEVGGYTTELSELSAGYQSHAIGWTPGHRVTLVAHDPGTATVEVQIEKITETVDETLHAKAHVARKDFVALDSDLRAQFAGHGHKMVHPGQTSPLMVGMRYLSGDQELASTSYNLYPPEDNQWTWRNFRFHLLAHEYDRFMDLQVERLVLEALVPCAQEGHRPCDAVDPRPEKRDD